MFDKIKELASQLSQAKKLNERIYELNEKLEQLRARGTAGGGLVTIEVNGLQEVVSCKIDPALFQSGDVELLEDLIVAAVSEAMTASRSEQTGSMKELVGSLDPAKLFEEMMKNK